MLDAPRQDWQLYAAMTRPSDAAWVRSLTPAASFALYADLFNVVWQSRSRTAGQDRLDRARWEEKLALRRRMAEAFAKLDQCRRGRSSPTDAG